MTAALTLHQPWASLIAEGHKTVETRGWSTPYRGPLAIHAGKKAAMLCDAPGPWKMFDMDTYHATRHHRHALECGEPLPLGAVVAMAELVDVVPVEHLGWTEMWPGWSWQGPGGQREVVAHSGDDPSGGRRVVVNATERQFGTFTPGRYAYLLAAIERLEEPVPARGKQGLWPWRP